MSSMEQSILICQWNDIRKNILETMVKANEVALFKDEEENNDAFIIDSRKAEWLVDISASMFGTPIKVAFFNVLVSEIASPAYGFFCHLFSVEPTWVEIHSSIALKEKVREMQASLWGTNVNF